MTERLDEFDKEEWWDVMREAVRSLGGTLSRDEYEKQWSEFCEMKRRKNLQ